MDIPQESLRHSQTALTLLDRLRNKELTLNNFLRECAYWAIREGFDEIRPLLYPTPPGTQAFNDYQALPPFRKAKVEQSFFNKYPEILKYYNQCFWVKQHNQASLTWLKEIHNYIPEDDTLTLHKIDNKIFEFQMWEDENIKVKQIFDTREI